MICLCCSFVVNVTATTEIYTYSHTLSLHDALPILPVTILGRVLPTIGTATVIRSFFFQARLVIAWYVLFLVLFVATRSEEHTSELQSLMRISYAVFCLKKKKLNRSNISLYVISTHKATKLHDRTYQPNAHTS